MYSIPQILQVSTLRNISNLLENHCVIAVSQSHLLIFSTSQSVEYTSLDSRELEIENRKALIEINVLLNFKMVPSSKVMNHSI